MSNFNNIMNNTTCNILVKRRYKGEQYTIGSLYINGKYFCDTLEDTDRGLSEDMALSDIKAKKIYGKTAIPKGTYAVDMNTKSPKYSDYKKYPYVKEFDGMMPRIMNVKGYEGVLIHSGNSDKDTLGCILVGENKEKGKVLNSRNTWINLMKELRKYKSVIISII